MFSSRETFHLNIVEFKQYMVISANPAFFRFHLNIVEFKPNLEKSANEKKLAEFHLNIVEFKHNNVLHFKWLCVVSSEHSGI